MQQVILVDTYVFLNVLDVPGFNQNRDQVFVDLESILANTANSLLLPFAAIIETGNHIAHLNDGRVRRKFASLFVEQVRSALNGSAPWRPTQIINLTEWSKWLDEFPDKAMTSVGLGDLSIIKEWENACALHLRLRVRIWALDGHLSAYDRDGRY